MKLLLGADPELFMSNEQGLIRSAHDVIPGTKEEPYPVLKGAIQVDGLALEINIDPVSNSGDFLRNITTVRKELQERLPAGHNTVVKGHHYFCREYMKVQPAESLILGCDPDFNAWTKKPNPAPNAATNMRTAAGHIHFGWTKDEIMDDWFFNLCCKFTKQLDWSVGLYCYLLDKDKERKKLYGRAGAFRPKPYGLEYRTPPNAWLKHPQNILDIFKISRKAFDDFSKNVLYNRRYVDMYFNVFMEDGDVQNLINNKIENEDDAFHVKRAVKKFIVEKFHVRHV